MADPFLNSILPDINSFHTTKFNISSKDLFTKKLGHNIAINFNVKRKNYSIFKTPKNFHQRKIIPKNKTNIQLSFSREENLRKIWENKSIFNITHKNRFWGIENNKQMMNIKLDTPIKRKRNKKEIKNLLNEREKFQKLIPQLMIYDSFKSSRSTTKNIRKENSKESFDNKRIKMNKKLSFQNLRLNKNNDKFGNVIVRITREEKKSKIFIKSFNENIIDINISYELYNKYISLVNKFNETYYFLFDIESFPITPLNILFLDTYKISCILIVSLIFLGKDKDLYMENIQKMKELLQQYIYTSIKSIDYKSLESIKINDFMSKMKSYKEDATLIDILNEIINILFKEKKNEYKKLRKSLKQLINNIGNLTPNQVLSIVNDSILFCNNCDYFNTKSKKVEKINKNKIKDKLFSDEIIKIPFIKNKMTKKFCLVLDLDETLIHNMIFPFGNYFFVRPGLFELFEKVHDNFEIIIFTAGKKGYAHKIIDKIDYKNHVDYILNKNHITNIEGNTVKKLDLIGRDLNKTIYVDNLEKNAIYNKKNLYLISSWYNNMFDKELFKLKDKLIKISTCGKFDEDITKGLLEEEQKTCESK